MWYVRLLIFFHMVGACIWVGGHLVLLVCHIAAVTLLSLAFVFMGVSFRMGW
ncbi:hypothetical protein [Sinomicrobium soli]|uniref:hypothetical protein n=1 Tax=Sinomicrobium sp. N-1-3-6 TaxID=2219864 RepID=UPI001374A714|nr:hypothetical protein [Sinomicrobium sp. N-1-3-6]